ncbi:hypothetical protein [Pseudonocardia xishanensis]|uniref:STAS domain-containing protein n=1 Tax=Pseudonocardia xishanensis TaxID=630995 RepID=A0ABP8RSZ6_9PSEU
MTRQPRARLALTSPARGVHVVAVHGTLDRVAGIRLLRLVEVRVRMMRDQRAPTRRLIIDVTDVDGADRDGLTTLRIARDDARRRGVTIDLVGDLSAIAAPSSPERRSLALLAHPTLGAALDART